MMHPCRNCSKPWAALREGGLCYRCWHWFEYGTVFDEGNRIGSGAAQKSLAGDDWPIQEIAEGLPGNKPPTLPSKRPRKGPRT